MNAKRMTQEVYNRYRRLETLNRARGHYLYNRQGHRYLDLYLNGGRCLLGHRPERYSLVLKQTLEKGLTADYPAGPYQKRIEKLAKAYFPGHPYLYFFRNSERAALTCAAENIGLWRPYQSMETLPGIVFPVFPLPGSFEVQLVCSANPLSVFSDAVSPFVLSGLLRVMEECRNLPALDDSMALFDGIDGITRNGPYLSFSFGEEQYGRLFDYFWDNGILISPDPADIGCVPLDLSESDLKMVKKVFKGMPA